MTETDPNLFYYISSIYAEDSTPDFPSVELQAKSCTLEEIPSVIADHAKDLFTWGLVSRISWAKGGLAEQLAVYLEAHPESRIKVRKIRALIGFHKYGEIL